MFLFFTLITVQDLKGKIGFKSRHIGTWNPQFHEQSKAVFGHMYWNSQLDPKETWIPSLNFVFLHDALYILQIPTTEIWIEPSILYCPWIS